MTRRTKQELEQYVKTLENELDEVGKQKAVLQEGNIFYSNIIDHSLNSIIVINPDTSIRYVNPTFERATGYTFKELAGRKAPYPWWIEESPFYSKEEYKKVIQDRNVSHDEETFQRRNGERFIVEITNIPIFHNNEILYTITSWVEITNHKQMEMAFRESERRLSLVLKGANISWWDWDMENDRFVFDPRWIETFGYKAKEFEAHVHSLRALVHPDDRPKVMWSVKNPPKWRRDRYVTEYRLRAKSGEWRWIMVVGNVVETNETGKPTRATGIHYDITERREAERALRESEERFKVQYQGNPTPIFIWQNRDNCFFLIDYNEAADKITNNKAQEYLGKSANDIFHNNQQILHDFQMCHDNKRVIHKHKPSPDFIPGKHVVINYVFGPPNLVMVHVEDVTEQVKTQEEKKKLEAQFWQAQKMESLGTLAGGLAHDFNNLLQTIQGNVSLISYDIQEDHPHHNSLKDIEEAVQSGAQLTRQLLGFAKGGVSHIKRINLNDPIETTCDMFGRTKKEIQIHREYSEDPWAVEADPGQIEQVLLNIYINAWQAMPNGGHIHIKTENVVVHEGYSSFYQVKPGGYVKISIADTGSGMDKETLQRIFEPFFTTKEMGRGTGLGLASAYGIIKNHGGIIDVNSEIGQGTTFNIYLPASDQSMVTDSHDHMLKGTERILLVDDEVKVINIGKKILETLGYRVWTVRNGKDAIDYVRKSNRSEQVPDLVILDMILPDMGGGEVYDRIKNINPKIKFLLSSGYVINGKATEILKRGCDGFIQKPFNMDAFSKSIREILDKA